MREALELDIPGRGHLVLKYLLLDYNGTLADRGALLPGVTERLRRLSQRMEVHILTADTFGTVREALKQEWGEVCPVLDLLPPRETRQGKDEGQAKRDILENLGKEQACAVGNGRNDVLMLEAAALSFAVLGREGLCPAALARADILVKDVLDALDLLLEPRGITATLRC